MGSLYDGYLITTVSCVNCKITASCYQIRCLFNYISDQFIYIYIYYIFVLIKYDGQTAQIQYTPFWFTWVHLNPNAIIATSQTGCGFSNFHVYNFPSLKFYTRLTILIYIRCSQRIKCIYVFFQLCKATSFSWANLRCFPLSLRSFPNTTLYYI